METSCLALCHYENILHVLIWVLAPDEKGCIQSLSNMNSLGNCSAITLAFLVLELVYAPHHISQSSVAPVKQLTSSQSARIGCSNTMKWKFLGVLVGLEMTLILVLGQCVLMFQLRCQPLYVP